MSRESIIVLSAALLFAIIYLAIIRTKVRDEWWAACHTMVSVLVSVVFGLGIGFMVFHWEREVERESKHKDLLQLVDNELGLVEMDLAINGMELIELKDTVIPTNLTVLPAAVFLQAGISGVFTNVQSWRMLALKAQIAKHNTYVEHFLGLLRLSYSPMGQKKILQVHSRILTKQNNIRNNCMLLRKELEIEDNKYAKNMIKIHDK